MASSRTFKLRLSPAGLDLLIESHFLVVRSTRRLLAWGTTLQVALDYLDTLSSEQISAELRRLADAGLSGSADYFLGGPHKMSDAASKIAQRVCAVDPGRDPPLLAHIYIVALQQLAVADCEAVDAAYRRALA